jgi:hypothetical protein
VMFRMRSKICSVGLDGDCVLLWYVRWGLKNGWWYKWGVRFDMVGQMGSAKCVVVQMGSENCCGGSDGE